MPSTLSTPAPRYAWVERPEIFRHHERASLSRTTSGLTGPPVLASSPEIGDFWCADESFALANAGVRREGGRFHRPPLTWRL